MKNLFLLVFVLLLGAVEPALRAQHEDHERSASKVEKPVVFLDKSPRIVAYQLARLSNEQLLLVDRDTSDPKYVPVHQAILTRSGMAARHRQEAVSALSKLNKTSEPAELLGSIKGLDAAQSSVLGELAKMLLTQRPEDLKKNQPALEDMAASEGPAPARRSAFAALVAIQSPDAVWNFAQEKPAGLAQLLAALPLVPDAAKRAAFFLKTEPLLKPGGEDELRRAAIGAAARMPGHETVVFNALTKLVASGTDVPECARAFAALPKDKWPADELKPLADALLEQARKVPEDKRTEAEFLDLTQLGTGLAAKLPKDIGVSVRKAFHRLGVNVLRLRTLPEQMFYDKTLLVVEAAKSVELILENPDAMQHNWVLVVPGALEEIGMAADKMAPIADSQGRTFVPDSPKVLFATKLLNGSESTRLRFTAPSQPDKYPYACTFPGHWQRMRGTFLVVKDLDEYLSQSPAESDAPTITEWKLADLVPELPKLTSGRSVDRGKELFTTVGCIACHKIGDIG